MGGRETHSGRAGADGRYSDANLDADSARPSRSDTRRRLVNDNTQPYLIYDTIISVRSCPVLKLSKGCAISDIDITVSIDIIVCFRSCA